MPEEIRTAVHAILARAGKARTASQIKNDLAGSFRISLKELTALLNSMAAVGEIYAFPGKKYWNRRPEEEALRRTLEFLTGSSCATAVKIRSALKLPPELTDKALDLLVAEDRVHVWEPGKTRMYCLHRPQEIARDSILNAVQLESLDEKELVRRIRRKLPGYTASLLRESLRALLKSGQVLEHPRYGKMKAKYGSVPPDPGNYLDKVATETKTVHNLLAPSGVSLDGILAALGRKLGLATGTAVGGIEKIATRTASSGAESQILQGIAHLQPLGKDRALVSIRDLRRSLDLSKRDFDSAVFSLALKRIVALHHHDFPASLSEEEREELVRDEQGTYYVGIVPKEV